MSEIEELKRQLAAAQAENMRLRKAIDRQPYTMDKEVCDALATPPGDNSALLEIISKVLWESHSRSTTLREDSEQILTGEWIPEVLQ